MSPPQNVTFLFGPNETLGVPTDISKDRWFTCNWPKDTEIGELVVTKKKMGENRICLSKISIKDRKG